MLRSVHMWAWYRGDQKGMECWPRRRAVCWTAVLVRAAEARKEEEVWIEGGMKVKSFSWRVY